MNSATQSLSLINGRPQAHIAVGDRGLAYGDGLFETVRFKNRYLPLWPLHWQRLVRGAGVLGLDLDSPAIQRHLETALDWAESQQIVDGVIKLIVTRGEGGYGYRPLEKAELNVILTVKPYQAVFAEATPVELKNCIYKLSHNSALAGLKHLNRLEQVLASQSVALGGVQQGLVFDKDECVIETLHHNLFTAKNGELFTPDLTNCGVAGTLRCAILEVFAPAIGISATVGHLNQKDLEAADEVFICNAVHGITPVARWQDKSWQKNTVTQQLMQSISSQWNDFYN